MNRASRKVQIIPLYMPGTNLKIYDVEKNRRAVVDFLIKRFAEGSAVITSDYKRLLQSLDIPLYSERLNVYEMLLPSVSVPNNPSKAKAVLQQILPAMAEAKTKTWHRILANAAPVLVDLEQRGLFVHDELRHPQWSQRTYTGRTKTSGFNIQGATSDLDITNPSGNTDDYFLHFDWRAADIRVAALLSGDDTLAKACQDEDPYQYVANFLNRGHKNGLSRDDCKIALLSSINAMDTSAHIFDAFPGLRSWISECRVRLDDGQPLYSLLGRKFVKESGRKDLSVFNATMQGTIAQAMQIVIREIWERFRDHLVADIHDSIVLTCPRSKVLVSAMIKDVVRIMVNPFAGFWDSNPVFPVRVSIGAKWKKWKTFKVYH